MPAADYLPFGSCRAQRGLYSTMSGMTKQPSSSPVAMPTASSASSTTQLIDSLAPAASLPMLPRQPHCPDHRQLAAPSSSAQRLVVPGATTTLPKARRRGSHHQARHVSRLKSCALSSCLPSDRLSYLPTSGSTRCTLLTGPTLFLRDATNEVLLVHTRSGAVRRGPWITLRTSSGLAYFANLVS